jgi:hypothetical protein
MVAHSTQTTMPSAVTVAGMALVSIAIALRGED